MIYIVVLCCVLVSVNIYWNHGNSYLSFYTFNARGVRITIFFFVAFVDKSYFPCKLYILRELHLIALWYESLWLLNRYCVGQMIFSSIWDNENNYVDYNTVQYYDILHRVVPYSPLVASSNVSSYSNMSQCHYNKGINRNGYQFSIVLMLFRSDYKMVHDTTYVYAVVSVS